MHEAPLDHPFVGAVGRAGCLCGGSTAAGQRVPYMPGSGAAGACPCGGGAHGVGGQHISGAERIVTKNSVEQEMISMLHRAWEHDRGAADFIQFKVEAVRHEGITLSLIHI